MRPRLARTQNRWAILAGVALAITAGVALGGHEVPVYPSYFPHEITIRTAAPETAVDLMRSAKLQAYVGAGSNDPGQPPGPLRAVESLGSFLVLTVNPASPLAQEPDCDGVAAIVE